MLSNIGLTVFSIAVFVASIPVLIVKSLFCVLYGNRMETDRKTILKKLWKNWIDLLTGLKTIW